MRFISHSNEIRLINEETASLYGVLFFFVGHITLTAKRPFLQSEARF